MTYMYYAIRTQMTCFLVATLLLAAPAAAQEVAYNDLTEVGPNPLKYTKFILNSGCNGFGSGSGSASTGPATYPLKLSLMSVDTSKLLVGNDVLVLLRLQNVGHDPASVPWITDSEEIELPDENGTYEFSRADLGANIDLDLRGGVFINFPVHLYGTQKVHGSLQEIRPGEFVELRVRLALDCKTDTLDCRLLRAGPAKLSFTWTEWSTREIYTKCGIDSSSTRVRQLTSDAAAVDIVQERLATVDSSLESTVGL